MKSRITYSIPKSAAWVNENSEDIFEDASEGHSDTPLTTEDTKVKARRQFKKSHFPKWVKHILTDWLYVHRGYPYPTVTDRAELLLKTGLSRKQLRIWLINARKRIIPTFPPPEKRNSIKNEKKSRLNFYEDQILNGEVLG
jgi:hypothetical protein